MLLTSNKNSSNKEANHVVKVDCEKNVYISGKAHCMMEISQIRGKRQIRGDGDPQKMLERGR